MRFNVQAAALRLVAIALASLMAVLIFSGIQVLARVKIVDWQSYRFILVNNSVPEIEEDEAGQNTPWSSWQLTPQTAIPVPSPVPVIPDRPAPASRLLPDPANSAAARVAAPGDMPPQQVAPAHPTNYGDRYRRDINGKPVHNAPIIVLHETVGSADSAIQVFQTPHLNENDQVSYHSLIRQNGTIIYVVAPEKRAFGAGNSVFNGASGAETVKTHRLYPPSVNNFAYHISLETPPDGQNNGTMHSGYTEAQYKSLAWLLARTPVPNDRITTHRQVDQSGSRLDPRSFDRAKLMKLLQQYPRLTAPNEENPQPPTETKQTKAKQKK
ncbi:MAG TPA: peptidoglycan recognition family protein [Trichocoleus sp.]|jgi:N-acetyl-anhydromuramyl-L-alanine amidase AmpD